MPGGDSLAAPFSSDSYALERLPQPSSIVPSFSLLKNDCSLSSSDPEPCSE